MKLILLTIFVASGVATVRGMDKEEAKDMFRSMSEECREKEKASKDDVEVMVNEKYPDTKEGKCLMACMQEQFGVVS